MSERRGYCPRNPAETARAYCRNRLSDEEADAFEDHYTTCESCAEEVRKAEAMVRVMKEAARRTEKE